MISENPCDGLEACIGERPNDALRIIEREAEDFDEAAVEKHLAERRKAEKPGCKSTLLEKSLRQIKKRCFQ